MVSLLKDILLIFIAALIWLIFLLLIIGIFLTKVPYVPSKNKIFEQIFKEIKLKPGQIVYDLGCGDGRFLFRAEKKYHIKGIGYELVPLPYLLARIWKAWGKYRSKIILGDFFKSNLKDANVIFCYLFPQVMDEVYQKALKECQPGTILVSNTFTVKNIKPTKILFDEGQKPKIYIYKF